MSTRNRNARAARPATPASAASASPAQAQVSAPIPTLAAAPSSSYKDAQPIEAAKRAAAQKAAAKAQAARAIEEVEEKTASLFSAEQVSPPLGVAPLSAAREMSMPASTPKAEFSDARFEAQRAHKGASQHPVPSHPAPKRSEFSEALLQESRERTRANNIVKSALSQELPPDAMRAVVESRLRGQALEIGRELTRDAGDSVEVLVRLQESRKVAGALEAAANKASSADSARSLVHKSLDDSAAQRADDAIGRAVTAVAKAAKPEFSDARFEAERARKAEASTPAPEFSDARYEAQRTSDAQARPAEFSDARFEAERARKAEASTPVPEFSDARYEAQRTSDAQARPVEFSDARFEAERARKAEASTPVPEFSDARYEAQRAGASDSARPGVGSTDVYARSLMDVLGVSREEAHRLAVDLQDKLSRSQQFERALPEERPPQAQSAAQSSLAASIAASTSVSPEEASKNVKDFAGTAAQQQRLQDGLAPAAAMPNGTGREEATRQAHDVRAQSARQQSEHEQLVAVVASAAGSSRDDASKQGAETASSSPAQQNAQNKLADALQAHSIPSAEAAKTVADHVARHQQVQASQEAVAQQVVVGARTSAPEAASQVAALAKESTRLENQRDALAKTYAQATGGSSEAAALLVSEATGHSPRSSFRDVVATMATGPGREEGGTRGSSETRSATTPEVRTTDKHDSQSSRGEVDASKAASPATAPARASEPGRDNSRDVAHVMLTDTSASRPATQAPDVSSSGERPSAAVDAHKVSGAQKSDTPPASSPVSLEQALAQHMKHHGFDSASVGMAREIAVAVKEEHQSKTGHDVLVLHKTGDAMATFTREDKLPAQPAKGDTVLSMETLSRAAERGVDPQTVQKVRDFAPESTRGLSDLQVAQAFSNQFLDRAQAQGFPTQLAQTLDASIKENFRSAGSTVNGATSKSLALEHLDASWGQGMSAAKTMAYSEARTGATLDAMASNRSSGLQNDVRAAIGSQVEQQARASQESKPARAQAEAVAEMSMH